jgi:hypothetical protein
MSPLSASRPSPRDDREKAGKGRNKPKIKGLQLPLIRTAFDPVI